MELRKVFNLARSFKDYDDFKSSIDLYFNETPPTIIDNTQYELVKSSLGFFTGSFPSLKICFTFTITPLSGSKCSSSLYVTGAKNKLSITIVNFPLLLGGYEGGDRNT